MDKYNEKIINAVKCCTLRVDASECGKCGYSCYQNCIDTMLSDLEAALHRPLQKPLTLEELTESVGIPVCFESHGTYMGKKCWWMIPQKFIKTDGLRTYGAKYVQADPKKDKKVLIRFVCEPSSQSTELGLDAYGTVWRAWKTKPTEEERDAAKWE